MIFRDSIITNFEFIPGQQKEGEEGISLFGRVPSVYIIRIFFHQQKRWKEKGETWAR